MKVIFLEDVRNVAKIGETKEVADGYGRNYLIPRKLAVLAGSHAFTMVEAKLKIKARQQAQDEAEMQELSKKIEGREIILKAKTGESERLYGSITSSDIADELIKSAGIDIDKKKIELEDSIRQLGSYDITVRLTKDIAPKIKLMVVAEEKEAGKDTKEKVEEVKKTRKAAKKKAKKVAKAAEAEEPEAAGVKAEKPEATDVKAEKPEAADTKVEEPETTDMKVEEPEATDVKAEEPEAADTKVEEPEATDVKAEEPEAADEKEREAK